MEGLSEYEAEMQAIAAAEAAEAAPAEAEAEESAAETVAGAESEGEAAVAAEAEGATEAPAEGESEPEVEAPAEGEKPKPKSVPLAELLKERDKRKALETELAVERARMEERERIASEQRQAEAARQQHQQQPAVEDAIKAEVEKQIGPRPEMADDPIGAEEWDRQFNQRKENYERQAQNAQIQNDLLVLRLNNERVTFERDKPDYQQALEYLKAKRLSFYLKTPAVRRLPEAQREQAATYFVNQEAGMIIQDSQAAGINVAQTIYELAEENGYVKAAPKTEEAPKQPTAEEKLMTSAAGKKIVSLAAGAGGAAPSVLSDAQIDDMTQDQLSAWLAKSPANEARYRKMLGAEE